MALFAIMSSIRNFSNDELADVHSYPHKNKSDFHITKYPINFIQSIKNEYFFMYLGKLGTDEFSSNFLAFQIIEDNNYDDRDKYILANNFSAKVSVLSMALWFVKDNAVTTNFTVLTRVENKEDEIPAIIRRNVTVSTSTGNTSTVNFSKTDMVEAKKWYEMLIQTQLKSTPEKINFNNGYDNQSLHVTLDVSSFVRAQYLLDTTRKTDFLPSKIAGYISILESLLAVKGDNTHKVSERVAFLIGVDSNDRIKLFKEVKKAYSIRSDYIHGSEFKTGEHGSLPENSKIIDEIVRKVSIRLMTVYPDLNYKNKIDKINNRKSRDQVDTWFNELVLSGGKH